MINIEYYKISEVAKLTGVSRQTLIYYDKEDILKPEFIDDNSYRYYTIYQIHQIQLINMLKEFGTPLKVIRDHLKNRDELELLSLLEHIKLQLKERILLMQGYMSVIDESKNMIDKSMTIKDFDSIQLIEKKAMKIFTSQGLTKDEQAGIGHFNKAYEMENKLKSMGILGLSVNAIIDKELLNRDYNNQISRFYVDLTSSKSTIKTEKISAGLYLVAYHKGAKQNTSEAYHRMFDYIESNNLIIDGNAFERNIINYITKADHNEFLSEISIKVGYK